MKKIFVNINTPLGIIYNNNVNHVLIKKDKEYSICILYNHAPILIKLDIDEIRLKKNQSKIDCFAVSNGIVEVKKNIVSIFVQTAEYSKNIDILRAKKAKFLAEELIKKAKIKKDNNSLMRANILLHKAINRINVAKHF